MNLNLALIAAGSLSTAVLLTLVKDDVAQSPTMYQLLRVLIQITIFLGCLFLLAACESPTCCRTSRSHQGWAIGVIALVTAVTIVVLRLMRARAFYLAAALSTGLDLLIYLLEAGLAAIIMLSIMRRWPTDKAAKDDSSVR
ncbi:MAG: hypothetical protein ACRCWS_05505 [Propionibacteriaceae bacterium]